ncbi:putative aldouronate transport system substrate-binding protein [Paenibacillus mucilaginosus]|uniref:extracellular solute-binding protein n=1 Tax=Paenibacillus mucilaginosus TaxID=61624 RepID=UPI003D233EFE
MRKRTNVLWRAAGAAAALSLVVSGCSGEGNENAPTASPGQSGGAEGKKMEIVWANNMNAPEADNNAVEKYLEDKFNVSITNVKFERTNWKEKFGVLLASGQIPDIFPIDANEVDMAQWADQGVIASIAPDDIKKHMPRYTQAMEAVDPGAWDVGHYNGKNWGIPKVWPGGNDPFVPGYNEAWLKKAGFSQPPKTLAEYEQLLAQFANGDPDGNGKKDTFGLSGRGKLPEQMFTSVFMAHGVSPYQFIVGKDGKITWGGLSEEVRTSLKLLNKWYKSGWIDPEFVTTDNNQLNEKFANQKIGVVDNMKWGNFDKNSGFIAKPGLDKGQAVVPGTPIVGPAGQPYGFAYGPRQAPLLLGAQLEQDGAKRVKIMQILDELAADQESWVLTVYGQEGVNYEKKDGIITAKTNPEAAVNKVGAGSFYNPLNAVDTRMAKLTLTPAALEMKNRINAGIKPVYDALLPASLPARTKYWSNLKTQQDTYIIKAVLGEADTDKAFDEFKAGWLKNGGQEVLNEANQVYAARKK